MKLYERSRWLMLVSSNKLSASAQIWKIKPFGQHKMIILQNSVTRIFYHMLQDCKYMYCIRHMQTATYTPTCMPSKRLLNRALLLPQRTNAEGSLQDISTLSIRISDQNNYLSKVLMLLGYEICVNKEDNWKTGIWQSFKTWALIKGTVRLVLALAHGTEYCC